MRTCLLVADSARGRLFKVDRKAKVLVEIKEFLNPEARLHKKEFMNDAPGRSYDSKGQGRHAMQKIDNSKDKSREQFANNIVQYLDGLYKSQKLNQIIIVAPSKLMGFMNSKLSNLECDQIVQKITKELSTLSKEEIFKILEQELLYKKII